MTDLLHSEMGTLIQLTKLSRKMTIEGVAKAYPVYRIRLDQLYYNDQNDRIATWIAQYKAKFGDSVFDMMKREEFNEVIQQFVVESNSAAIDKTQMNIQLVGQREPGVVLNDGRVIDGNRRFTCLRRLSEKDESFNWFEAVILDRTLDSSRKQIKMLELAIQHGEEKKVDYNPLERLVGVYQDVIETKLLTIEEYAFSTNETVYEVQKRIEHAQLLVEFLEYVHLPKQYFIAREYQIVSVLNDLLDLLKRIPEEDQKLKTKQAVFTNIMMKTMGDGRKYIRNIGSMMQNGFFSTYLKEQEKLSSNLKDKLDTFAPETRRDLDEFVRQNEEDADLLTISMDRSLLKAKKQETRNKPSQIVTKSITMLRDVDTRIFDKLTTAEKDKLRDQIDKLSDVIHHFDEAISEDEQEAVHETVSKQVDEGSKRFYIAPRELDEPAVFCREAGKSLSALTFSLSLYAAPETAVENKSLFEAFFISGDNQNISNLETIEITGSIECKCDFMLDASASSQQVIYLAIRSKKHQPNELQHLIPFRIDMLFCADMNF